MGVTFQAQINHENYPQKKVYMVDIYPDLDEDYFKLDGYCLFDEETQRHYQMERVIDFKQSRDFSYANFYLVLDLVDRNISIATEADGGYYSITHNDLQVFRKKVFIALNKVTESDGRDFSVDGNFYNAGASHEYIRGALSEILEIIDQAYKKNLNIFWA